MPKILYYVFKLACQYISLTYTEQCMPIYVSVTLLPQTIVSVFYNNMFCIFYWLNKIIYEK